MTALYFYHSRLENNTTTRARLRLSEYIFFFMHLLIDITISHFGKLKQGKQTSKQTTEKESSQQSFKYYNTPNN